MPRQTPSASDFTSVVRSSAVANDVASKPAGSPAAARAAGAAVRGGGGLASLGAIGSIVKQSVVAKAIAPPPVRATVVTVPVVAPLSKLGGGEDAFVVAYDMSGIAQWAAKIESGDVDAITGIATDSDGNVYTCLYARTGSSNVYSSDGTKFTNVYTNGVTYLIKYNSSGIVQWVAKFTSNYVWGVTTDKSGNVYIGGHYDGGVTATAYSSNGNAFSRTLPSYSGLNAFIVKYNANGIVQWTGGLVSIGSEATSGLATDSDGNLYVTGYCGNTGVSTGVIGWDGVWFATLIPSEGAIDAFLVKYNTTGSVQWVTRIGSAGNDRGNGIATDINGNIYVVGQSSGTPAVFNSDSASFGTLPSSGGNDAFVVKYNTNGTVQWMARIASNGSDIAKSVATDSNGNVYVCGSMSAGATAFSSNGSPFGTIPYTGADDAFVVKYDTNGNVQWVANISSSESDQAVGIAVDSSNNVYVTGEYGPATLTAFSANSASFAKKLTSSGLIDAFVVKYNSNGVVQWTTKIGGIDSDNARSVSVFKNERIYVGGYYLSNPLTITNAA